MKEDDELMNSMQSSIASDLWLSLLIGMIDGWDLPEEEEEETLDAGDSLFFLITTRRKPFANLQPRCLINLAAEASVFLGNLNPQLVVHPGFLPP